MDQVQPRGRNMRSLALGAVLVALTGGDLLMVRQFNATELPSERHFGVTGQVGPPGEVYLEPVSIDVLNDAMQLRAYVSPSISESKSAHSASDRDWTLLVSHDNTVEEIKLASRSRAPPQTRLAPATEGGVRLTPRGPAAP
jgi:hypothetical protein